MLSGLSQTASKLGVLKPATRLHVLLIFLGVAGTVLGLLRDVILVHAFGISANTDTIQLYLAPTYVISILGDSARLTTLNLVVTHSQSSIRLSLLPITAISTFAILGFFLFILPTLDPWLLTIAAIGGALNIYAVSIITSRQSSGQMVRAQLAILLPHALLLPVALCSYAITPMSFIHLFVLVHSIIPISQILFLWLTCPPLATREVAGHRFSLPFQHGLPLYGGMIFAQATRAFLPGLGEGYLTIFLLVQKFYDSLKSLVIDTKIVTMMREWKERPVPTSPAYRLGTSYLLAAVALPLAFMNTGGTLMFACLLSFVLLASLPIMAKSRVRYFQINALGIDLPAIRFNAINEAVFAMVASLAIGINPAYSIIACWAWFTARPLSSLCYLTRKRSAC